ncbi:sugar ABC transporter permease [Streptomyces sp. LHD-70]|uniref:carbohydrate ABC transporter permease n=1 Tax=Streptomyces sp. LHD-70 TaxID=3072140 RepID=UPI00280E9AFA|nr:sugar ABC transporter permease [Streptomyces sp. LHD-70]MDQ8705296.1 sugar ABC transporter permease [Streptomyces sp. LHD-70]
MSAAPDLVTETNPKDSAHTTTRERRGPGRRAAGSRPDGGSIRTRQARTGWIYTTPALLVVAAVTIFPVVYSVVMSFTKVRLTHAGTQVTDWTTANYTTMLASSAWREALLFTVGYTLVTVAVEIALGIAVAVLLERLEAGRGWLLALLLIPWSLITVVSAQLWDYLYDATYGAVTWLFGLVLAEPPVILGTPVPAITGMAAADIWKTTPFVAVIVLAGLVRIPREQYEAAEMDGAGSWTTFRRIVLPALRPVVAVAVLFRVLQAFGIFDLPFVLTQGGPGTATQSLAILGYRSLFQDLNIGLGAAIATSTGLLVVLGCLLFLRVFRSQVDTAGEGGAA